MEGKRKIKVWVIVVAVVALLGSFMVGGVVGGFAGFAIARRGGARMGMMNRMMGRQAPESVAPARPNSDQTAAGGARITSVVAGSPAESAGIVVGDVIVSVNGVGLQGRQTLADLISNYKPGEQVTLGVAVQGALDSPRDYVVTLGHNPDSSIATGWLGIGYVTESAGGGYRFRQPQPTPTQPDRG